MKVWAGTKGTTLSVSPKEEGADDVDIAKTARVFSPSLTGEGWRSAAGSSDGERLELVSFAWV